MTLDADGHNREERSWGRKGGRGKVEEKEYGVLVAEAAEEERNGRSEARGSREGTKGRGRPSCRDTEGESRERAGFLAGEI